MRILVANDDGIDAPGLKALAEILAKEHEVYVVAPNKERSAMGHALTLHRPLRMEKLQDDYFVGVKQAYEIEGSPTDCVKIAINKILPFKPDWVISGINHGPNMASDILYSGTVSVAIEGSMYGIKSIAFSLAESRAEGFEEPAKCVPQILNLLSKTEFEWGPKTTFNVNIPAQKVVGIAFVPLALRMYSDAYIQRTDPRGRYYYWLAGDLLDTDANPDSDIMKVKQGYITITPITFEMTNFKLLNELKETFSKEKITL